MSSETPSSLPERDLKLYLRDMVEFCERVADYGAVPDLAALLFDRMRYDAILRNVELIGEAATHVPLDLRAQAPEISWRQVIGTRNRVAHGYLGIEAETVWIIVRERAPELRQQLLALLARLP